MPIFLDSAKAKGIFKFNNSFISGKIQYCLKLLDHLHTVRASSLPIGISANSPRWDETTTAAKMKATKSRNE